MKGTIQGGNLADVFREIITGKKSGLLFLKHGGAEKGIYFSAGRIVNAESNQREEGLGFRLLEEALLTPQELEGAMRQVEPGRTLADVLTAGGTLASAQLEPLARALAEQIAVSSFDWTEGSYFFQEGDFSFKGEYPLDTPHLILEGVRRMFDFEASRERLIKEPRSLYPLRGAAGQAASLQLDPAEGYILSRVDGSITSADICALSLISEEMTCRVLLGLLTAGVIAYGEARSHEEARPESREEPVRPAPRAEPIHTRPAPGPERPRPIPSPPRTAPTERPAAARVEPYRPSAEPARSETRAAASSARPAAAAAGAAGSADAQKERVEEIETLFETIDRLNHFAALGLARDAPRGAIHQAWTRLADRLHPAKNPWIRDESLRSKLVFVFAKVKNAYETLIDERRRAEYEEGLRRHGKDGAADVHVRMEFAKTDRQLELEEKTKISEALFREAGKLFELQRYHVAREKVLKAIEIHPEDARFYVLAGRIEALNPNIRWQKEAEAHLRKGIAMDPWKPDYRVHLGMLYKNAGMAKKAKREFIHTLELDPSNEIALAEVPPAERPVKKETPTAPPPVDDAADVDWS